MTNLPPPPVCPFCRQTVLVFYGSHATHVERGGEVYHRRCSDALDELKNSAARLIAPASATVNGIELDGPL
jgi:hypothetical protein